MIRLIAISALSLIVAAEAAWLGLRYTGIKVTGQKASTPPKTVAEVVLTPKDQVDEVKSILAALDKYQADRTTYPRTLQDLMSKYLRGPKNPALGFSKYRYVPVGDPVEYFTLVYSLSADYGDLTKGNHIASPKGLTGGEYPASGSDLDNDGVDDAIEIYVYRTDSQSADTDSDGFTDGVEIGSGHNPRGK